MEPKKNPKADLKQWSGVYFLAGLAFMLFLSWQAVEWKSYDRDLSLDTLNVGDDLDEDIPITELLTPPPPPPPPPPPQVHINIKLSNIKGNFFILKVKLT